ncbi:peptidoglycan glycosyltransferase FtsW [Sphingomonas nostoxanthinifaciens]|uniref:peptidoglycan glycosyltransferase FtsW n=1 Tax=Sphingomonas nostoxanthinifaciens TaxID=2872652 RepID=UPI001CC1D56D|nr:putative peptidoglycan glycosyltransferase FtsW [Sphingomonas nostoxanthinifaciens]UAK26445.1 putative lipid II flippase FtsW [Sphingomonas nostoxanthinifaciens]
MIDPAEARRRARARRRGERFGRGDRSALATWFWEIDHVLLVLVTLLIGIGLIAVAAAAPAAAQRYSDATHIMPSHYYFWRQLVWTMLAVPVLIGVSMLPKVLARRFALAGAAIFFLMLVMVPVMGGAEKNGAQRWIYFGPIQVQPSEFLKPLFVVAVAWMLSLKTKDDKLPVVTITAGLLAAIGALLMHQPDFGQTVIFVSVWLVLLTLSGVPLKYLGALGGAGVGAIGLAYLFYPVATARINGFLKIGDASKQVDDYQMVSAYKTITHGGLIGTGPGAGTFKFGLPEPHTDYIFSVIGEEFGLVACVAIALIYLAIVVRTFMKLLHEEDRFLFFASAGLVTQFGLQALINMLVNVHLAPSKGMTLPFISYGGSSMIALSVGFGLLLAFTRRNPFLTRSPYIVTWGAPK